MPSRRLALLAALCLSPLSLPAARAGTLIELSAEASLPAANDLTRAVVYAEETAPDPAAVARRVNGEVAAALRAIKDRPTVSAKTGGVNTYPVYGKERRIEGWRMRADLELESTDSAAMAALLGELQQMKLALSGVSLQPAPATRRRVETAVIREAIKAFEERAGTVADALGKAYRIKRLNIEQGRTSPPLPMLRAMRAGPEAAVAPLPVEAGESRVAATVSGEIELAD